MSWTREQADLASFVPVERFKIADGAFVPNDTYATDAASFQLVTGVRPHLLTFPKGSNSRLTTFVRQSRQISQVMRPSGRCVAQTRSDTRWLSVDVGKSTFLKQIASLVVMSQVSYLHAQHDGNRELTMSLLCVDRKLRSSRVRLLPDPQRAAHASLER